MSRPVPSLGVSCRFATLCTLVIVLATTAVFAQEDAKALQRRHDLAVGKILNSKLTSSRVRVLDADGCPVKAVTPPVTLQGTLTTSSCIDPVINSYEDVYSMFGQAGQTIDVDFQSTAFDGFLMVDGSQPGDLLCFGDTSQWFSVSGMYHSVAHCSLTKSTTYYVHAETLWDYNDSGHTTTGAYTLTIGGVSGAPSCSVAISVPPLTQSGLEYAVSWTAVTDGSSSYQLDQSTSADFSANVLTQTVTGTSLRFVQNVSTTTTFYYRVRATACLGGPGPYSATSSIVVQAPPPPATGRSVDSAVPFGSTTPVSIPVFIPGASGKAGKLDTTYTATTDKPFLTVTPPSGPLPASGTTVTVTANPTSLPPGASTGTLAVTTPAGPLATKSVSVSLVTPVAPGTKTTPPSNTLVIPVVTHVNGTTSPFQSDVRLTNSTLASVTYQVTMTPTQTDATKSSKTTTITVDPGQTVALNDIVKNFFGYGATGAVSDVGFGSLEIRPTNTTSKGSYAASRTFATSSKGTFGQFIAAIPFPQFAAKTTTIPVMSLQQIAESARFRTNLGLVEGSGNPASGTIHVMSDAGVQLATMAYSLLPGEHRQINHFLSSLGVTGVDDGRIEITVESATGAVTAYASVLDNATDDPLAVQPVQAASVSATRYIIPGMADLNSGPTNFHSDLRIYNGGSISATVTPFYFPQNGAPSIAGVPFAIGAGQVKAYDNVLPTLFGAPAANSGGSIILTTNAATSLVATGRTYSNDANGGTFGQFIPGVTAAQGIGAGDAPLQILQLEESANFRSNVGLAELTGNPVTVKVSAVVPDSKVSPSTTIQLAGNEFRQIGRILTSAGFSLGSSVYNARVTVEVVGGTGRVTAYGSIIDNATSDPTYVPAQ